MLTFELKVKFIGFMKWLHIQTTTFFCPLTLSYHIWDMSLSPWDGVLHT